MSELNPFDEFMDALVHCDTVKVILTGCGESTFETKPIYEGICALAYRRAQPANEPLTCDGCKNDGKWESEYEYGYPSPCTYCKRRASDNYARKPEGSTP